MKQIPGMFISQILEEQRQKVIGFICQRCGAILDQQHCPHCDGLPFGIAFFGQQE